MPHQEKPRMGQLSHSRGTLIFQAVPETTTKRRRSEGSEDENHDQTKRYRYDSATTGETPSNRVLSSSLRVRDTDSGQVPAVNTVSMTPTASLNPTQVSPRLDAQSRLPPTHSDENHDNPDTTQPSLGFQRSMARLRILDEQRGTRRMTSTTRQKTTAVSKPPSPVYTQTGQFGSTPVQTKVVRPPIPGRAIKLKYAAAGTGKMPAHLVRELPMLEKYFNDQGNLKMDKHSPYWDNKAQHIKLGHSPFGRPGPTRETCYEVFNPLSADLADQGIYVDVKTSSSQGPAHSTDGISIGGFLKTIFAQGTTNNQAIIAEDLCTAKFPFLVNGEWVLGKTPNYHAMSAATKEETMKTIDFGGLQRTKTEVFLACAGAIREANLKALADANDGVVPADIERGQPANTSEFIPGLLSCEFLHKKSLKELLNWFLDIKCFGPKTTACILSFNFGYPVFAVDTHCNYMSKYLGWAEPKWSLEHTFKHLDGHVPDELKLALHQAMWHHRRLCDRCKSGLGPTDKVPKDSRPCCIEHLVDRCKVETVLAQEKADKADRAAKKKSLRPQSTARALTAPALTAPALTATAPTASALTALMSTAPVSRKKDTLPPFRLWEFFKSAEEANAAGYVAYTQLKNDDFNTGSRNVVQIRKWRRKTSKGL